MQILRDRPAIAAVTDASLQLLIAECTRALDEFDDYDLEELVRIIVVEPADTIADIDAALGFPLTGRPFELLQEHADWFELLFVVSDDGFGIEVFIPKHVGVDPRLLDWCRRHIRMTADE